MVIDASALIAILKRESGYELYLEAMITLEPKVMASLTWLETNVVWWRHVRKPEAPLALEQLRQDLGIRIIGFDADLANRAAVAYRRVGKGAGRAGLNLGDCVVFALAEQLDLPVLSTSGEFVAAGLRPAVPPHDIGGNGTGSAGC